MASDNLQLNKEQKEAIEHGEGPLLIVAGAGTGKTTVVTERIKHLIISGRALSQEILALTFTEKASREMEERVDIAMPYGYTQMWISTFHSFCDRVLRNESLSIGLDTRFRLMTEAESIRFLRKNLFNLELSYFRPLGNPTRFIAGILQHFSRLKDEDILSEEYLKWAKKQDKDNSETKKWQELANAYIKYEDLKAEKGLMDYADLISNTLKLFRERKDVLARYHKQFKYILVDEFQDTNIAQNELVKLLVNDNENLTVVADDDQSIYKWRGAAVSNVIQFRKNYPKAKVVALTQNYRSTQAVLDAAYRLIQNNNPDRLEVTEKIDKKLKAVNSDLTPIGSELIGVNKEKGFEPEFIYTERVEDEADLVAKKVLHLVETEKRNYSDFAVLVRANNHAEPFSRAFSRLGIPFQFLGPGQLFSQEEVRELIAYLKVLYNFEDSAAFYKVLTMDCFAISARDLAVIANYARKNNLSFFETTELTDKLAITDSAKDKLKKLIEMIHKHLKLIPRETAGQILYKFLEESGILQKLGNSQSLGDEKRAQNISKLFDRLKSFETQNEDASIYAVVDWIDLSLEVGESPLAADFDWGSENAVNILTIHSSKGLEFPVVFVVNLVAQRFPTQDRKEQIPIPEELIKEILPQGDYHLQEERRLYYVALTRAKERVFVTAADYYGEGKREKKLSPFVAETFGSRSIAPVKSIEVEQFSVLSFSPFSPPASQSNLQPLISNLPHTVNYLSYSQIDCFKICPLHYKLRYVLGIPTQASAPLSFGSSLHYVMRDFSGMLMAGSLNEPKKTIWNLLDKFWSSVGYEDKKHELEMKKRGREYLANYLKSDLFKPDTSPVLLEQKFTFGLNSDLKIGGVIDRVDETKNGIEIIDYKTTDFTHKEEPTERELRKDLQLSVYAMAANKVHEAPLGRDLEEVTLSLYYFDLGKKVSTTRTVEELEDAAQEIMKVKEAIETSDFSCNKGFFCRECEYKMFCGVNG
ncbi:MAG: hypothetical protein A3A58_02865 [Candidatus Blackburnbacteria bacterium RIFCSPLOWO2_01_FULL_41_27]|uniref:DNA 3'-5' helicase n=2 Tax=Candidatus Blackburniibacteriota TaxID=1817898 RepID=A0A1G1V6D0_9BACT|nr:MAG: hypothetical protein A3F61_02020 [Candidatus Blackburnbacteria bacterium RIFCSPHIGHO2_12_FULL_41_13b]OGY12874.1 MAG: hypothetical protein A3A58_02865 [Candidatus Blackburnbacteria bacterium RIFCSPLOWO2_01_FULL_41_27]